MTSYRLTHSPFNCFMASSFWNCPLVAWNPSWGFPWPGDCACHWEINLPFSWALGPHWHGGEDQWGMFFSLLNFIFRGCLPIEKQAQAPELVQQAVLPSPLKVSGVEVPSCWDSPQNVFVCHPWGQQTHPGSWWFSRAGCWINLISNLAWVRCFLFFMFQSPEALWRNPCWRATNLFLHRSF